MIDLDIKRHATHAAEPSRTERSRRAALAAMRLAAALALCAASACEAAAQANQPNRIPPPEELLLETKDRLLIRATYYGSNQGKEAVPVILVHDYQEDRHVFDKLALFLQSQGCAVIVPDMRGHGDSTTIRGSQVKLNLTTFPVIQFKNMVTQDMEATKRFLLEQNNQGKLNIDKLCVLGAGMGAIVASEWAVKDWLWPPLTTGKQGQDVKALILISPTFRFKNLNMADALAHNSFREQMSVYIIVGGSDSKAVSEAKRLYTTLESRRPKPATPQDMTVFFDDTLKTTLQGTKLLGEQSLNLEKRISQFIDERAKKQNYLWLERKNPLGS